MNISIFQSLENAMTAINKVNELGEIEGEV
jgi:hypothetical protein